jgi:hypothetical protein
MNTPILAPANDDFPATPGDRVAAYFAWRPARRGLSAAAAAIGALILTTTLSHGFLASTSLADLSRSIFPI